MKATTVHNATDLDVWYAEMLVELSRTKTGLTITTKKATRTAKQNNALHSTLNEYAQKLNDAGYFYTHYVASAKGKHIVVWTTENLKRLFKITAGAMYNKRTTTSLTTVEIQEVYKVFAERLSELSGVYVDWHNIFSE